jgi:hypothetical protein
MDTLTINNLLRKNKHYLGTFSRDTLPNIKHLKGPAGLIANTDISSKPGTHWVAIFVDKDGVGDYFDSYGNPPLHQKFMNFLINNCPNGFFYNRIQLQCLTCVTYGHYCVAYIKMRSSGLCYCHFISLFTSDSLNNDKLIKKYVPSI